MPDMRSSAIDGRLHPALADEHSLLSFDLDLDAVMLSRKVVKGPLLQCL